MLTKQKNNKKRKNHKLYNIKRRINKNNLLKV